MVAIGVEADTAPISRNEAHASQPSSLIQIWADAPIRRTAGHEPIVQIAYFPDLPRRHAEIFGATGSHHAVGRQVATSEIPISTSVIGDRHDACARAVACPSTGEKHEEAIRTRIRNGCGHDNWGRSHPRLHAQAKPPVYAVIPILKVTDADTFKQIGPKASTALPASGGHCVIRSDKITPLDGTPPQRLIVIAFDSMEQAQAWHNSAAQKEMDALRVKSTKSLSFIIEGAVAK